MLVVTGTKRSDTSMWMQILSAAGLPTIGSPFPSVWEESIREANPRGFYESRLRKGIFYATNPNPRTGEFLAPRSTQRHAVKVFIPGLISRVLATVRDWRSRHRLYALEDAWLAEQRPDRLERARAARVRIPSPVEWWFDNHERIRDVSTRRYPFHATSYACSTAVPVSFDT